MQLYITCTLVWITRQVYEPLCVQISSTIEYILFPGQNIIATTYPAKDPKNLFEGLHPYMEVVHAQNYYK